jgi:hypothetical protein
VKERQDSIAARIAGTIAGGVRRRQQDRTPRALVYDAAGESRIVPAGSEEQVALIETAEVLVGIALEGAEPAGEPPAGDDELPAGGDELPAADDESGAPPEALPE